MESCPQLYNEDIFSRGVYIEVTDNQGKIVGSIGIDPDQEDKT